MKRFLTIYALAATFLVAGTVYAAPYFRVEGTLVPRDSTENIGTSTDPWDEGHFNEICLSADCKTAWPGGGGGSGTISTSSAAVIPNLLYFTGVNTVGNVATTTLSGNSQVAVSNSPVVIGASGAVLSIVADSIGDSQLAFNTGQALTTASSPTFAGLTVTPLTSALLLTDASGVLTEYAGTSCTNQFPRSLSALGAATCASVSLTADVSGTLPVANGGTGITALGAGVADWLGTPSAANLRTAVTGTTGSGNLVFATSPAFTTPDLGTPSAATLTNATGLPIVAGTTGTLTVARGGTGATTFTDDRVLTGNGTSAIVDEANLTFSSADLLTITSTGTGGTNGLMINNATAAQYANLGFNANSSQIAELGSSFSNGALVGPAFGLFSNATNGLVFAAYNAAGYIDFVSGGLTTAERRVRITAAGNVGINDTSPQAKLDVFLDSGAYSATAYNQPTVYVQGANTNGEYSGLGFTNATQGREAFFGMVQTSSTAADFVFQGYDGTATAYKEYLRVTNIGRVGISTTSPESKLDVWGTSGGKILTLFSDAGSKFLELTNAGVATLTGTWDFVSAILRAPYGDPTTSTNGDFGIDSTSNQWQYQSGAATRVLGNGNFYPSFSYATSTTWTGTTTIPLGPSFVGETWNGVQCFTDTGTVNVSFYDGTNRMNMFNASTTVGTVALSSNNTFTAAEKRYVDVGTPASTPTKIACTVSKSLTAD